MPTLFTILFQNGGYLRISKKRTKNWKSQKFFVSIWPWYKNSISIFYFICMFKNGRNVVIWKSKVTYNLKQDNRLKTKYSSINRCSLWVLLNMVSWNFTFIVATIILSLICLKLHNNTYQHQILIKFSDTLWNSTKLTW